MGDHQAARMRRNRFSSLANIGFGAAMSGMYLLGIGWCGYGILMGTISFGTLTAITQLISQIQTPFVNITGYLPRYYAMHNCRRTYHDPLLQIVLLHILRGLPTLPQTAAL